MPGVGTARAAILLSLVVVGCGDRRALHEPLQDGRASRCGGADCAALAGPCREGFCDPVTGACAVRALADGARCDDADPCTTDDRCSAGACGGAARDCSELGGPCLAAGCDRTVGCFVEPVREGLPCDDADRCTSSGMCSAGSCVPGAPIDCGAENVCRVGRCDAATGACVEEPASAATACDDGDPCTTSDHCDGQGGCVAGTSSCDDGVFCNGTERCDPALGCLPAEPIACDASGSCAAGACDEAARACAFYPDHDRCGAGRICDLASGSCRVGGDCAVSAECDDGFSCNGTEQCLDGVCAGGAPIACDDGVPCTDDDCVEESGCVHVARDDLCRDGVYCNGAERCDAAAGACVSGPPPSCDDQRVCTADACDAALDRCVHALPDADLDGYGDAACGGDDCDDVDGEIHPGATESCDIVDQDCDGAADEGFAYGRVGAPTETWDATAAVAYESPSVAALSSGGFGVGYFADVVFADPALEGADRVAQRNFFADGSAGASGVVFTATQGVWVRITSGPGGYGLTWRDDSDGDLTFEHWFVPLEANGLLAPGVRPVQLGGGGTGRHGVASDGVSYAVAWPDETRVRVAIVDDASVVVGGPVEIDAGDVASSLSIRWNGSEYGVSYVLRPTGAVQDTVRFARLDAGGGVIGAPVDLSSGGDPEHPDLAWGGDTWAVIWSQGGEVRAQLLDARGRKRGATLLALSNAARDADFASIAWTGSNFVYAGIDDGTLQIGRLTPEGELVAPLVAIPPQSAHFDSYGPTEIAWQGDAGAVVHTFLYRCCAKAMAFLLVGCGP